MLRPALYLLALLPCALAYPVFSAPVGGQQVAGTTPITVTWTDSGSPANSLLTTFTLTLYAGGNEPGTTDNAVPVGPVITAAGSVAAGTYTATLTTDNLNAIGGFGTTAAFYFAMESVATGGGTITTYSDRFILSGTNGPANQLVIAAAQAVTSTAGPAPLDKTTNNAAAGTSAGGETGMFAIPYQSQTGLTKYAPMQGLPPTKISAKTYTPLYPTSAWSTATTWLPPASVLTTLTEPVTYSVSSMENTAAPQSNPTGDMAKFLARWKD